MIIFIELVEQEGLDKKGTAVSFMSADEHKFLRGIEGTIKN
jgi:hypothetical protein